MRAYSRHADCAWLAVIIIAAAAFRIFAWNCQIIPTRDSLFYTWMIENYDAFGESSVVRKAASVPPLFIVMLHTAAKIAGSAEIGGVLMNFIAGLLLVPCVYGIGRAVFKDRGGALLCAFLIAVNPILAKLSITVQREPLYLTFCAMSLYLALREHRNDSRFYRDSFFCGVAAAAAASIRYEGMEMMIYLPPVLYFLRAGSCRLCAPAFRGVLFCLAGGVVFALLLFLLCGVTAGATMKMFMAKLSSII